MFAVPREQVARIHASSGTTGKPTVVGYTLSDIDTWADLVARSIRAAGGRPGDMVHVAYGYGLFTGGLGAHYGAERAGLHRDPDVGRPDREAGAADPATSSPTSSWSRPRYMQVLDRGVRAPGASTRVDQSLEVGIFGAEPWTEAMRARDRGQRRHRRGRHLRPLRSDGPGRRQRMRRDQGRPGDLGRPLLSRDHRSRDRRGAARRRGGRAGLHHAHQGGAAGRSATARAT